MGGCENVLKDLENHFLGRKLVWLFLMKLITETCRLKHIGTSLCVTYCPLTDGFQLTPLLSALGLFHNIT